MKDIYDLLKEIKARPALYTGGNSIFQLQAFIEGYFCAKRDAGIPLSEQEKDFENFHQWLEERLRAKTNLSWAKIIAFRSSNEIEATKLFFKLFDEFVNRDIAEK